MAWDRVYYQYVMETKKKMIVIGPVSEDDIEIAVERVLELIEQGYTSGVEPAWSIDDE